MKFTIVTACFNRAKTIGDTFQSVLDQHCDNLEYEVVDGGSTDGTLDVIHRWEPRFEGRMHVTSEPDRGVYDAINKGVARAAGDLIGIMNSDDRYAPDALHSIAASAAAHPGAAVYYGLTRRFDENGNERMLERNHQNNLANCTIGHQACFFARAAHEKYGLYDTAYKICADYDFLLKLDRAGEPMVPVDAVIAEFTEGGLCYARKFEAFAENFRLQHKYGFLSATRLRLELLKLWLKQRLRFG